MVYRLLQTLSKYNYPVVIYSYKFYHLSLRSPRPQRFNCFISSSPYFYERHQVTKNPHKSFIIVHLRERGKRINL